MFIEELKLLIAYNFFWEMISEKNCFRKNAPHCAIMWCIWTCTQTIRYFSLHDFLFEACYLKFLSNLFRQLLLSTMKTY